jgi:hypothetical protein
VHYSYLIIGGGMTAAAAVQNVLLWNVWGQADTARQLIAAPGPFQPGDLIGCLPERFAPERPAADVGSAMSEARRWWIVADACPLTSIQRHLFEDTTLPDRPQSAIDIVRCYVIEPGKRT